MFEAASRLLDSGGIESLTTNRVAELAGVSIGTLYQYFPDKTALLDAMASRELETVAQQVLDSLTGPPPERTGDRIRAVVRAVMGAYGGRTRVHRLLEHALRHRADQPMPGLRAAIVRMMSDDGVVGADHRRHSLAPSEAFVLTHAIAGVVRAQFASSPPLDAAQNLAIEDALVRLATVFIETAPAAPPTGSGV